MLLVLLLAIIWFATGKKRLSLLAFFALLTNGFMLVPDIAYTVVANLKPSDYGILYIISVSIIAYIKNKDCYKDRLYLPRYTIFLLSFLFVSYLVSVFLYHIPAFESLKYVRKYILLLAPFAFALYTTEEIEDTIKTLFKITVIQCVLYLLQPILDMQLLTGTYTEGQTSLFGIISIPRFYNIPLYLWFFIYYLCYKHDTSDKYRFFLVILMFLPVIVSMHRSHLIAYISVFILSAAIVHLRKSLPLVVILLVIAVPFSSMVSDKLARNESLTDIKGAFEIDYEDFSVGQDGEATFTFRVMHFYERMDRVLEKPITTLFGLGYMAEGSNYSNANFDFFIGLEDEETGDTYQFDTADIAWSEMIVRLGFGGIIVFLLYYISLMLSFMKDRSAGYNRSAYCGMILLLILSLTSMMIMDMSNMVLLLAVYEILKREEKEQVVSRIEMK